ncbi:hypothetical protein MKX01_007568 [Papaver californicum]|nr:hypothetical protein MKX01_007568 [Papaver californicum]
MEVDQGVGVLAEVVTPTEDICPAVASTQTSELSWVVVEAVAEDTFSSAAKQDKFPGDGFLYEEGKHCKEDIYPVAALTQTSELTWVVVEAVAEDTVSSAAAKQDKFPGAGRLYEEGKHCEEVIFLDEKFKDVGGFSVLKTQASLYKDVWLNYGHIASNKVLPDLYSSQVALVSEIMTSIVDMNRYHLEEVSSEMIDSWEKKIKVAETLEFNIGWLRERLEDIKKNLAEEKKLQETLMEQVQAKARVIEAEQQLVLANDGLNMAKERLFALEAKITPLLMERQNFLKKCCGRLLLFNCDTKLSLVKAPVQKDAILIEEPIDNSNSKTVPSTGIAVLIPRRTRTLTTSISPANESKRESPGDGAVDGTGQHLENKSKASKDGSAEITSTPSANQLFTEDEIKAVLLQQPNVTTQDLVLKFRSRLRTKGAKLAFYDILKGICKILKMENGACYLVLAKK